MPPVEMTGAGRDERSRFCCKSAGRTRYRGLVFGRANRRRQLVARLLHSALIEIRAAAYADDAERARRLADAFHNAPIAIAGRDADSIVQDIRARCERHGEGEWFVRTLREVELARP